MLPYKLIEFIKSAGRKRTYPKGSIIVHQGDKLDAVYLIESGFVSLFDTDKYGNARISVIYPHNQVFPVSWLLSEPLEVGARFSYEALTEISCFVIGREKVHDFLRNNPGLCKELLNMMTRGFINAVGRIYNLQKSNVGERIDYIINFFANAYGKVRDDGLIELDTVFTHQQIADFAGVSREVVSRELVKPKYKKALRKVDKRMLIDLKQLKANHFPPVFRISSE